MRYGSQKRWKEWRRRSRCDRRLMERLPKAIFYNYIVLWLSQLQFENTIVDFSTTGSGNVHSFVATICWAVSRSFSAFPSSLREDEKVHVAVLATISRDVIKSHAAIIVSTCRRVQEPTSGVLSLPSTGYNIRHCRLYYHLQTSNTNRRFSWRQY